MKVEPAKTFEDFNKIVEDERTINPKRLIWRGQSNAKWPLETSLERFLDDEEIPERESYPFSRFYSIFREAMPFVKKFSGLDFVYESVDAPIIPYSTFEKIKDHWNDVVLLRHYGFPSFLLDWTRSPWIALYFAFEPANGGEERAIYVHKLKNKEKKHTERRYHIETIDGFANERRHRMQQCWLSCAYEVVNGDEQNIIPYEKAIIETGRENEFVKITLPSEIRNDILVRLSEYNINHFTLFENAEAVMRTAALEHFVFNYDNESKNLNPVPVPHQGKTGKN